ncbi:hypothetical protein A0H81_12917 [Grifola frondosa]|uniref:Uncharacterized protein n=1 Tax=Grifola frondosa TaxID=5627 RepID=A0A1C7LRF7_GRIFR|nr:hypothetical protein A0H81_12917 [Grifola frondosa]
MSEETTSNAMISEIVLSSDPHARERQLHDLIVQRARLKKASLDGVPPSIPANSSKTDDAPASLFSRVPGDQQ